MEHRTVCVVLLEAFVLANHLTSEELVEFLEGDVADVNPFAIRIQRDANGPDAKRAIKSLRKHAKRLLSRTRSREQRAPASAVA